MLMVLNRAGLALFLVKVDSKEKQSSGGVAKVCPAPHQTLVLCSIRLLAEVEGEWWPQAAEPSLSLWALCSLHFCPPPAVLALGPRAHPTSSVPTPDC